MGADLIVTANVSSSTDSSLYTGVEGLPERVVLSPRKVSPAVTQMHSRTRTITLWPAMMAAA
jgi:hypothetical protein